MNPAPSFLEATRVWLQVALQSFGGPAGQIAVMHRLLVERHGWISENRFLNALNYCMLLPGPEAQQLATYIGWVLHGVRGGLVAGGLFVLPGFLSILALSFAYAAWQDTTAVQALFFGIKAAVIGVLLEAVGRIGKRALKNRVMVALSLLAFVAIFLLKLPFPLIVLSAGVIGLVGGRVRPDLFHVLRGHGTEQDSTGPGPSPLRTLATALVWLALWLVPLGLLAATLGPDHVLVQEGVFFSQAALVTFGGAYAVLAYIAQQAVTVHGWLGPGEMLDGLGMAESTPGPLIQVVQFVGFMGAFRHPQGMNPWVAGLLGSLVTTWMTYCPCFLWIFTGAPYVEHLRARRGLSSALSAITAAVVGVIANLAGWFSLHTLFSQVDEGGLVPTPVWGTLDPAALAIAVGSAVALLRFHAGMLATLGVGGLVGALVFLLR